MFVQAIVSQDFYRVSVDDYFFKIRAPQPYYLHMYQQFIHSHTTITVRTRIRQLRLYTINLCKV